MQTALNVMTRKRTREGEGLLQAVYEGASQHPLPEAVQLAGVGQEVGEQHQTQLHRGGVQVSLEEQQEPIVAQRLEHGLLLAGGQTRSLL